MPEWLNILSVVIVNWGSNLTTEPAPNGNKSEHHFLQRKSPLAYLATVNSKDLLPSLILSEPAYVKLLHSIHVPLAKFRFRENHTKSSGLVPAPVIVK